MYLTGADGTAIKSLRHGTCLEGSTNAWLVSSNCCCQVCLWLQAKTILIATGGRAVKLPIDGAEHAIISDEILNLPSLPKKLAVIGGGYIGLEFAGIYNNYGSEVHVVYRQVSPDSCCCRSSFMHLLVQSCV